MLPELIVLIAFIIGGIVHTVAGFGSALVTVTLTTLFIDIQVATPLQAMAGLSLCVYIFYQHRAHWLWFESLPLIAGVAVGIPFGTYALTSFPKSIVLACLAQVVLGYAVFDLIATRRRGQEELIEDGVDEPKATRTQVGTATIVGFLSGLLVGAYAAGGPPVVIYAAIRRWHKERFKSILQSLFIFSGVFLLAWQAYYGLITRTVGWFALFAFPGLLTGVLIGRIIDRRIDHARFRKLVLAMLLVLGVTLLTRALAG